MSMPDELFYPVGTVTCIMVFRAGIKHNSKVKTWFGYWKDDGFMKLKKKAGLIQIIHGKRLKRMVRKL